jgi:hypothetical protein
MSDTSVLYLRGMPRALVREAKIAAAQQGVTLTRLVARALESVLASPANEPDDLAEEMKWFETNRARLVKRYAGEFVAIQGQAVIDHDTKFDALADRVFAKHGPNPIFIPRVEAAERIHRLGSPRVVSR